MTKPETSSDLVKPVAWALEVDINGPCLVLPVFLRYRDVEMFKALKENRNAVFSSLYDATTIERLIAERDEHELSFDLRWRADMRAIERWQTATGRTMVWPDHADLAVWLMERLEAAESLNARQAEALKWFLDRERPIQAKFTLHGPKDLADAMVEAFARARSATESSEPRMPHSGMTATEAAQFIDEQATLTKGPSNG